MSNTILDSDLSRQESDLVVASLGKRFANLLIDSLVFGFLFVLIGLFFGNLLVESRLMSALLSVLFYFVLESTLQGKTIGKMVTGTRVVDLNGDQPETNKILLRSFCRIVPFEPISFFIGEKVGWHDKWSETLVIDEKLSGLA